jgi:hypothetical protein
MAVGMVMVVIVMNTVDGVRGVGRPNIVVEITRGGGKSATAVHASMELGGGEQIGTVPRQAVSRRAFVDASQALEVKN